MVEEGKHVPFIPWRALPSGGKIVDANVYVDIMSAEDVGDFESEPPMTKEQERQKRLGLDNVVDSPLCTETPATSRPEAVGKDLKADTSQERRARLRLKRK